MCVCVWCIFIGIISKMEAEERDEKCGWQLENIHHVLYVPNLYIHIVYLPYSICVTYGCFYKVTILICTSYNKHPSVCYMLQLRENVNMFFFFIYIYDIIYVGWKSYTNYLVTYCGCDNFTIFILLQILKVLYTVVPYIYA